MELSIVRILSDQFASALKVKISHYSYGNISFFIIIIILFSLYAEKNAHYAGIMLNAPTIALCPKLCQHNVSNPMRNLMQDVLGMSL